jgi:hypothetical protein
VCHRHHDRHLAVLPLGRRGPGAVLDLGVAGDDPVTEHYLDELGEMHMKTVSRTMLVLPLLFLGNLSLENNGGFASVRTKAKRLGLEKGDTLVAKVRGDGREYSEAKN